jgi:hypothetical protein
VGFVANELLDDCARKDQLSLSLSNQRAKRCQNRVLPIISGEIQPYARVDKKLEQQYSLPLPISIGVVNERDRI